MKFYGIVGHNSGTKSVRFWVTLTWYLICQAQHCCVLKRQQCQQKLTSILFTFTSINN